MGLHISKRKWPKQNSRDSFNINHVNKKMILHELDKMNVLTNELKNDFNDIKQILKARRDQAS
jgi:hypothetical protein